MLRVRYADIMSLLDREALRAAAQKGWDDVEAGRFTDLTAEELSDHIARIGARAAHASKSANHLDPGPEDSQPDPQAG